MAACLGRTLKVRMARHTALLHLKPEPNASCQMRSLRRSPRRLSMYASTYLQTTPHHASSFMCTYVWRRLTGQQPIHRCAHVHATACLPVIMLVGVLPTGEVPEV